MLLRNGGGRAERVRRHVKSPRAVVRPTATPLHATDRSSVWPYEKGEGVLKVVHGVDDLDKLVEFVREACLQTVGALAGAALPCGDAALYVELGARPVPGTFAGDGGLSMPRAALTLRDALEGRGKPLLTPAEKDAVARDAFAALRRLHGARASHNDVKLENLAVVVEPGGALRVQLLDLGLAGCAVETMRALARTAARLEGVDAPDAPSDGLGEETDATRARALGEDLWVALCGAADAKGEAVLRLSLGALGGSGFLAGDGAPGSVVSLVASPARGWQGNALGLALARAATDAAAADGTWGHLTAVEAEGVPRDATYGAIIFDRNPRERDVAFAGRRLRDLFALYYPLGVLACLSDATGRRLSRCMDVLWLAAWLGYVHAEGEWAPEQALAQDIRAAAEEAVLGALCRGAALGGHVRPPGALAAFLREVSRVAGWREGDARVRQLFGDARKGNTVPSATSVVVERLASAAPVGALTGREWPWRLIQKAAAALVAEAARVWPEEDPDAWEDASAALARFLELCRLWEARGRKRPPS